jgi:hypothetical protein
MQIQKLIAVFGQVETNILADNPTYQNFLVMSDKSYAEFLEKGEDIYCLDGDMVKTFGYSVSPVKELKDNEIHFVYIWDCTQKSSSKVAALCLDMSNNPNNVRIAVYDTDKEIISYYVGNRYQSKEQMSCEYVFKFKTIPDKQESNIYITSDKFKEIIQKTETCVNKLEEIKYKAVAISLNPRDYVDIRKWGVDDFEAEEIQELLKLGMAGKFSGVQILNDRNVSSGQFCILLATPDLELSKQQMSILFQDKNRNERVVFASFHKDTETVTVL